MRKRLLFILLLFSVVLLTSCPPSEPPKDTALLYEVTQDSVVTQAKAAALAEALGLPGNILEPDGAIRFVDSAQFLFVPTKSVEPTGREDEDGQTITYEGLDFEQINTLQPIAYSQALSTTQNALTKADLIQANGSALEKHATLEAMNTRSGAMITKQLDTQVDYSFTLNGLKVVGPGAGVKVVFNTQGDVVQAFYALRGIKEGERVPIISTSTANDRAMAMYQNSMAQQGPLGTLDLGTPELVYYAPSLAKKVDNLYPHYRYQGTLTLGERTINMQMLLVPAIENAPKVALDLSFNPQNDNQFTGTATITGGTAPYSYFWSSSNVQFDAQKAASASPIVYFLSLAREQPRPSSETLSVTITDANGLVAQASKTIPVPASARVTVQPTLEPQLLGRLDAGAEGTGACHSLPHTAANAINFANFMNARGVTTQFLWTETNAWDQDFEDTTLGGDDNNWVDDVDVVFFSDHGSPGAFYFCNDKQTDGNIDIISEARWGNRDLEWIGIDACNVSMGTGSDEWWKMGAAFQGLHLLASFRSVNYDTWWEGEWWAKNMLDKNMTVVDAWATMSRDTHGPDVEWAVMGVCGANGASNFNDHFWNRGSVGPDIIPPFTCYWRIRGPS